MSVLAVILAAGAGSRYVADHHKLAAPFRDGTVLDCAVRAALDADIGPVLVVTSDATPVMSLVGVEVIENERWADGQAGSLQLAVAEAERREVDAIVVGLGDQPLVTAEAWRIVATTAGGPIVTASYDGHPRPPVRLDRAVWPLLPTDGDEGARVVMSDRPDLVVAVPVPGDPADIDTVEDVARWS